MAFFDAASMSPEAVETWMSPEALRRCGIRAALVSACGVAAAAVLLGLCENLFFFFAEFMKAHAHAGSDRLQGQMDPT